MVPSNQAKVQEKNLHSKEYIAESIEKMKELMKELYTTILARDHEVVAVWLESTSDDFEIALIEGIIIYRSTKIEYRLKELKDEINRGQEKYDHDVISFINCTSIDANNIDTLKKSKISDLLGSYAESTKEIIACVRKTKYKPLFSKIEVRRMRPIIIDDQPILS
uniref:Uncharacterized protein n=1 Tax=Rhizophagus irregularis (strain DAOM 181602 / DAOM 197198 / MUCL 43194) TaxID=747089 RepID=U9TNF3_RHIID